VKPFRIEVRAECVASLEKLRENASRNSHHPFIETCKPHGRKLALVGGGPGVLEHLDELHAWGGDIWAINHTAQWLNERGIKATLFSVDPEAFTANVPDAILASVCDPDLVESLAGRVRLFNLIETHPDGYAGGRFSSTRAPGVALHLGYTQVYVFGCEGSWIGQDHVDRNERRPDQLIVRAGGKDYITCPPFLIQCEELQQLFYFDGFCFNRSGGLLKAMIENPDTWEVVAVSEALKKHLEEINGPLGLYERPYVPGEAA
jgi:hypothetical protein